MAISKADYIAEVEQEIQRLRAELVPLESGKARQFDSKRDAKGKFRDITATIIAEKKRTIGILENILTAYKEGG
jgi:DNA-binding cell septation regulator SpoVG